MCALHFLSPSRFSRAPSLQLPLVATQRQRKFRNKNQKWQGSSAQPHSSGEWRKPQDHKGGLSSTVLCGRKGGGWGEHFLVCQRGRSSTRRTLHLICLIYWSQQSSDTDGCCCPHPTDEAWGECCQPKVPQPIDRAVFELQCEAMLCPSPDSSASQSCDWTGHSAPLSVHFFIPKGGM